MGKSLSDLQPGQVATINKIKGARPLQIRLAELGFIRGTKVSVDRTAPMGNPRSYVIRGAQVSLRNGEAKKVHLDDIAE